MKRVIILSAVILMAVCNTYAQQSKTEHRSEHGLVHDNGSKWKVSEKMKVHLVKMQNDISTASQSKSKNHKALATSLQSDIENLISNCSMSGKAHDELHKWLMPYMKKVKDYSDETDPAKADQTLADISGMMETFNRFFE